MARYYAAEDEGHFPPDDGGYPDDGGGQDEGDYEDGGSDEGRRPLARGSDALVAEAENDLAQYDQEQGSGDDGGGDYSDTPADDATTMASMTPAATRTTAVTPTTVRHPATTVAAKATCRRGCRGRTVKVDAVRRAL